MRDRERPIGWGVYLAIGVLGCLLVLLVAACGALPGQLGSATAKTSGGVSAAPATEKLAATRPSTGQEVIWARVNACT